MKGIHYNNEGTKPVAYAIMKSLYSSANRDNNKLKSLTEEMENDMPSDDMETDTSMEAAPIPAFEATSTQTEWRDDPNDPNDFIATNETHQSNQGLPLTPHTFLFYKDTV